MTQKEKIEYLAKAVMALSELGDGKTAYVLNEIRLEMKSQLKLPDGLEEEMDRYFETMPVLEHENIFEDTFKNIARHFAEFGRKQVLQEIYDLIKLAVNRKQNDL